MTPRWPALICLAALVAGADATADTTSEREDISRPAPASQASGPRAVQAAVAEAVQLCRAAGGRVDAEEGFDRRADLNGDGVPDHVLSFRYLQCTDASDDYYGPAAAGDCGRLGCAVQVFVSSPQGHALAYDDLAWSAEIDPSFQPTRLKISTHGGPECGADAATGCHASWGWDGQAFRQLGWTNPDAETSDDVDTPVRGTDDEAAIRALLTSIYESYRTEEVGDFPQTPVLTPSFEQAIDRKSDPDTGLGYDYFCACQDYGDVDYRIESARVVGQSAEARVMLSIFNGPHQPFDFRLQKTPGGWLIDDITDSEGSLRASLR